MKIIERKLAVLRNRVYARQYAERPILTVGRRIFARLGFFDPPKFADLGFFVGASLLLFFAFAVVSQLSSGVGSAKRILGETAIGFEFLKNQDLEAARLQFAKIENEIEGEQFYGLADRIPEVSSHILKTLEILHQGEGGMLPSFNLAWDPVANASSADFFYELLETRARFAAAAEQITMAQNLTRDLPTELLPAGLAAEADQGLELLRIAHVSLQRAVEVSDFSLALLGGEPKIYMLIFQNNNEARATGGFIGTYGLAELGRGRMKILKIESIYEPDGQLKEQIAAPGPLQRQASQYWGMRDANWFADFPSSSRKLLEFLEKETGVLAEGVISFTPDIFEDLLVLTGPVDMPEYGAVLTAQNFREISQYQTSVVYDPILNQPKKFLADFAPRLLTRLGRIGETERIGLFGVFVKAIAQKHLLMFSLDPKLQQTIQVYGAGGEIRDTEGDYLAIIHSNVGGGKTDQGMGQSVQKSVMIDELGRQISTLRITRTNNAGGEVYFPKNLDFMRVFVPMGSKIISASGFDQQELLPSVLPNAATDSDLGRWDLEIKRDFGTGIYVGRESGYAVFMGWLEVEPGQTKTVELIYELPHTGGEYSLLLQKQAGSRPFEFDLAVQMPGWQIQYQYPQTLQPETVYQDRFYALIGR